VSIDSYADHLKLMNRNPEVSFDLIAAHTFDAIVEVIAGRFITMAQLALMVECFPVKSEAADAQPPEKSTLRRTMSTVAKYHSVKSRIGLNKSSKQDTSTSADYATFSLFSTMRIELVIVLFPQIVDLVNFDLVFLKLSISERAMLLVRLGILNMWSPLKLDGAYSLDLSIYEQRQVLKLLVLMAIVEPGENWVDESFREKRTDPRGDKWELPFSWFVDTTIPHAGIVSLKYFSGNGTGQNNCAPNPMARFLLMSVVHPQPYYQDAHKFQRASLTAVHDLNVEYGSSVIFGGDQAVYKRSDIVDLAKSALFN
jgi:hypothetical protein